MKLWKYNTRTGYWEYVRDCLPENAQTYLELFQTDEPHEQFKLSKRKPK